MLQLEALVQQPDELSTAAFCDELIVQNPLKMFKSGDLPLSLALIGVDLDGDISVAPQVATELGCRGGTVAKLRDNLVAVPNQVADADREEFYGRVPRIILFID